MAQGPGVDLVVEDVAFSPASGFAPGQTVTVSLKTVNRGEAAVEAAWSERVEIRNLTTNEVIAVVSLRDDLSQGNLAANSGREREARFAWPDGLSSAGRFSVRVLLDTEGEITEFNAARTGEDNNRHEYQQDIGPDLGIRELSVDSGALHAGELVTISWEEWNTGAERVNIAFDERIVVRNTTAGITLLDTSIVYDPQAPENGPILPGEARQRSYTFRLPEGLRGTGDIRITATADQRTTGFGVVFETNAEGDAERNNSADIGASSTSSHYADLSVTAFSGVPGAIVSGETLTLSWTVSNVGGSDATGDWDDQIVLSRNNVIGDADDVVLKTVRHTGGLAKDGSYIQTATVEVPALQAGSYHVGVRADAGGAVLEPDTLDNNQSVTETGVVSEAADLALVSVTAPANAVAGEAVQVVWEVKNDSEVAIGQPSWYDRIVLSTSPTGTNKDIVLAAAVNHIGALAPGEHYTAQATVTLPKDLEGEYYILVTANSRQDVVETDREGNNAGSAKIVLSAQPLPNLVVTTVSGPTGVSLGEAVSVVYTVENQGAVAAGGRWYDYIYIETADESLYRVATVLNTSPLAVGERREQRADFAMPDWFEGGEFRWVVVTDANNNIAEGGGENDNRTRSVETVLIGRYADLDVVSVDVPQEVWSGESILVTWTVRNDGNQRTDLSSWYDKVILSRDMAPSGDDIVLAGAVSHSGMLASGASYVGKAAISLPEGLEGEYYILVSANSNQAVNESGHTGNNVRAVKLNVQKFVNPDLRASGIDGPAVARPGDAVTVNYTVTNHGTSKTTAAWRDRVYIDLGDAGLYEVASVLNSAALAGGASLQRSAVFTLPAALPEGEYRWVVVTDADNTIDEGDGEDNNRAASGGVVRVAHTDLRVVEVRGPGLAVSDSRIRIEWTVENRGAAASGAWVDTVYLVKMGEAQKIAEVVHNGGLAARSEYVSGIDLDIPLDYSGEYEIVVVSDEARTQGETDVANNRGSAGLEVEVRPYADLVVSAVAAPERVIDDPAPLEVSWTVVNQGTAAGEASKLVDRVVLSRDDIAGNADDIVLGEFEHDGALAVGGAYSNSARVLAPAGVSARMKLFVITDARGEVFEHRSEDNNAGQAAHDVDIMPIPYADLQVEYVSVEGAAASGKPLQVAWKIANNGIGLTSSSTWRDAIWLSSDPAGKENVVQLAHVQHLGYLAAGDSYVGNFTVTLPEGIEGDYYIHVGTGGPFEFIHTDNNTGSSAAVPVSLSPSADLVVRSLEAPASAREGGQIEITWSVMNEGVVDTSERWEDTVWLVPVDDPDHPVRLGAFTYDRVLEPGKTYTRTEQVTLPSKVEGVYRIKVVTNANLGVYEHGEASRNNTLASENLLGIGLLDRPDLRVLSATVPEHVTAGTTAGIQYTIFNGGAVAASGKWTDRVYLSQDGILSADDILVAEIDNASALPPGGSYTNESGMIDIPIRYRGDAYLIIVADGKSAIDEYPNEGNNARAEHLHRCGAVWRSRGQRRRGAGSGGL